MINRCGRLIEYAQFEHRMLFSSKQKMFPSLMMYELPYTYFFIQLKASLFYLFDIAGIYNVHTHTYFEGLSFLSSQRYPGSCRCKSRALSILQDKVLNHKPVSLQKPCSTDLLSYFHALWLLNASHYFPIQNMKLPASGGRGWAGSKGSFEGGVTPYIDSCSNESLK